MRRALHWVENLPGEKIDVRVEGYRDPKLDEPAVRMRTPIQVITPACSLVSFRVKYV